MRLVTMSRRIRLSGMMIVIVMTVFILTYLPFTLETCLCNWEDECALRISK